MKLRIFKMAVGAPLAIYAAEALGLRFSLAAGVIVILSMGPTKKSSLDLAIQRLKATVLALVVGSAAFFLVGFNPIAFGVYLLVFLPLAYRFGMADGIVVNSVLVTHLFTVESIGWDMQFNSFLLMAIGAGLALLLNSIMPNLMPKVLADQEVIEKSFREILMFLAAKIRHQEGDMGGYNLLLQTGKLLEGAKGRADANQENYLTRDFAYYSKYMAMRFLQYELLVRMDKILDGVQMTVFQTDLVAALTEALAADLRESNDGEMILAQTEKIMAIFRLQTLPQTREEFENRARLFAYMSELRHFIEIKREFIRHQNAAQ